MIFFAFILVASLLGLRDRINARKNLHVQLKKQYGNAPDKKYRDNDLEHVTGFYRNHPESFQVDDITWNDLNMDGIYKRLNYCMSAAGEEYLYYMLRTPRQQDDFERLEKQVSRFMEDEQLRHRLQLIYYDIGRSSRYSIYDYLDYLSSVKNTGNRRDIIMLLLMALAIAGCFVNFGLGFAALVILMFIQILSYFRIKGEIEPYLASYSYIMRVISSVEAFSGIGEESLREELDELRSASGQFSSFKAGAQILLSPNRMNSGGNPVDLLFDYIRMITHIDIIKFNQMFRQIMEKKEYLDRIIEITGRIEALISVAYFRASFEGRTAIPEFCGEGFDAKDLIHPLIDGAVPNSIDTERGILLTGSNASGKSTFLKTCALAAIMAQSVHTVLGSSYRAPLYRIYSSMALRDDIFQGESYYMVEIKSIKRILDAADSEGGKVLCFVDEVLRGTNTVERIAASTQILKRLSESGVECFAATHDIELTSLLNENYNIYHFEGDVSGDDVKFDYRLKEGPATTRNAIKLLGVLGYDKSIVDKAQMMADGFMKSGSWEKIG